MNIFTFALDSREGLSVVRITDLLFFNRTFTIAFSRKERY